MKWNRRVAFGLLLELIVVIGAVIAFRRLIGGGSAPEPIQQAVSTAADAAAPSLEISLMVALALLSVTTLVAVGTSFYLYRWRRILSGSHHLLMPEEHGRYLRGVGAGLNDLSRHIQQLYDRIATTHSKTAELQASFLTLQRSLDGKDREIRRLKEGYDLKVFRSFVRRFLRVDTAVEGFLSVDEPAREGLEHTKRLLQDALEECGVEPFAPELGVSYLDAEGVADNPKTVPADSSEENNRISRVLQEGYRLVTPQGYEVIKPAKVEITIFSKGS